MPLRTTLGAGIVACSIAVAPLGVRAQAPAEVFEFDPDGESQPGRIALLGLDAPAAVADVVNPMLQDALRRRVPELEGGPQLAEVRLALSCDGNDPPCLARAGTMMLNAPELIYGEVVVNGTDAVLQLWRLDAAEGQLVGSASTPLPALHDASLAPLVDEMVGLLFGEPAARRRPSPRAERETPSGPSQPVESNPARGPGGELLWGPYKPVPRWKIAAAAVSGAVLVGGTVMWATSAALLRDGGPISSDLDRAARDSTMDEDDDNDVDLTSDDLCADVAVSAEGLVRNVEVATVCRRADRTRTAGFIGIGFAAVGFAATAAFTTLLFVHRKRSDAGARWQPTFGASARSASAGVVGRF